MSINTDINHLRNTLKTLQTATTTKKTAFLTDYKTQHINSLSSTAEQLLNKIETELRQHNIDVSEYTTAFKKTNDFNEKINLIEKLQLRNLASNNSNLYKSVKYKNRQL